MFLPLSVIIGAVGEPIVIVFIELNLLKPEERILTKLRVQQELGAKLVGDALLSCTSGHRAPATMSRTVIVDRWLIKTSDVTKMSEACSK